MNPLVRKWAAKAEGDYNSALREYRARKSPNYDSACFHAQQCVEKYFKGLMQGIDVPFSRTHDLAPLLDACLDVYPLWESMRNDLNMLTQYAVAFRYPGGSATKAGARQPLGNSATRSGPP